MNSVSNINIERAVLSSILFNYDEIFNIKEILKPSDFYLPAHQKVFEAMLNLLNNDMPIDEEFLRNKLDSKDVDDSILYEIMSANAITNTKAYVKEIKDSSLKRELVSLATTIKKVSLEDDIDAQEAINIVENKFYRICDSNTTNKTRDISQIVQDFSKRVESAKDHKGFTGLKSGINNLDNLLNGFKPGGVVAIGARPSMGKTSLAVQIACQQLKDNKGVVFDSLEMPAEDIIMRMVAHINQESLTDLQNGEIKDYEKYHETLKYLSTNQNLIINDKTMSFNQLKSKIMKITRVRRDKGLDVSAWFIDHVGYIETNQRFKREELTAGTKMLKQLAKELGITVFPLSQLNRDLKGRRGYRPMLSDFKETGSLEEDCDVAIFPHRDSYYAKAERNEIEPHVNPANILVLKNRNGGIGVVNLDFNGPTNSFGHYPVIEVEFNNISSKEKEKLDDGGMSIIMD
jgi:replicative DNA helicase